MRNHRALQLGHGKALVLGLAAVLTFTGPGAMGVVHATALRALQPGQQSLNVRGRIEGTVLQTGTMEPVSGARVTVTRVDAAGDPIRTTANLTGNFTSTEINAPAPLPPATTTAAPGETLLAPIPVVTTDRDGRFLIPNLDEGRYRILVTLNGYVRQEYGQRGFSGTGTPLTLARGEVVREVVVRMTRAGNVSGRVSDETGRPASAVPVQLMKVTYNQSGQATFQIAGSARTNDRGEYRIYWITPGRYYLAAGTPAGAPSGLARGGISPNDTADAYVFSYYPGTSDVSRANPIEVRAGDENLVDFLVARQQLYRIRGRIVDATTNQSSGPIAIQLAYRPLAGGSGVLRFAQVYDPATGRFEIPNVVPGSYVIQGNSGRGTVQTAIEVVNADIDNLTLVVSRGTNIAGKLRIEGGGRPSISVQVQFRPVAKAAVDSVRFSHAGEFRQDGDMEIANVLSGEYRLVVRPIPGYYVKSLRFEGNDALSSTITVTESRSALELVLSPKVGEIEGRVTDERLQSVAGAQVVLVPARNRHRTELFKAVTSDQTGRFSIADIAPGDYRLLAWETLEDFGYFDPDLLKRSESLGKPVLIGESETITVETKVIPEGVQ